MKEAFVEWTPTPESRDRLRVIDGVLGQYGKMDIKLTLRQLFYQLVSKNVIPNSQREYKRLGELLSKARLAGLVDWKVIEDRVRQAERAAQWDSAAEYCNPWQFRLPRWTKQPEYVELWCEKDALSSVLEPICDELHVTLMVNRGYSSSSAMYASAKRIAAAGADDGKLATIVYLGDFDPSGEDMVRDIRERMETFGVDVTVMKLALNPNQIKAYKLPPNPLKRDEAGGLTDSRGQGFQAEHGSWSYEVDALPPEVLQKMVRSELVEHTDMDKYAETIKKAVAKI
jgi:hypothetical protein